MFESPTWPLPLDTSAAPFIPQHVLHAAQTVHAASSAAQQFGAGLGVASRPPPAPNAWPRPCPGLERSRLQRPLRLLHEWSAASAGAWRPLVIDEDRRCFVFSWPRALREELRQPLFDRLLKHAPWVELRNTRGTSTTRCTCWYARAGCTCHYTYGRDVRMNSSNTEPAAVAEGGDGEDSSPEDGAAEGKASAASGEYLAVMRDVMRHVFGPDGLFPGLGEEAWPNSVNLNLYRDGRQGVGWHADDEALFRGFERDCPIVSLSLGATREFWIALKGNDGDSMDPDIRTVAEVDLCDGDIVTMEGRCQRYCLHLVPKANPREPIRDERINLTFRWVRDHRAKCPLRRSKGAAVPRALRAIFGEASRRRDQKGGRDGLAEIRSVPFPEPYVYSWSREIQHGLLANPDHVEWRLCDGCKHVCYEDGRPCCEGAGEWAGLWFCRKCWSRWEPCLAANGLPPVGPLGPAFDPSGCTPYGGDVTSWWPDMPHGGMPTLPMAYEPPPPRPDAAATAQLCCAAAALGLLLPGSAPAPGAVPPLGAVAAAAAAQAAALAACTAASSAAAARAVAAASARQGAVFAGAGAGAAAQLAAAPTVAAAASSSDCGRSVPTTSTGGTPSHTDSKPESASADDFADGGPLPPPAAAAPGAAAAASAEEVPPPPPQPPPPPPPREPPPPQRVEAAAVAAWAAEGQEVAEEQEDEEEEADAEALLLSPTAAAATASSASASAAPAAATGSVAAPEHPLACRWHLWLLVHRDGQDWSQAQQRIHGPIGSVEECWRVLRHTHPPSVLRDADYSLFRDGVRPAREDPRVLAGGRWLLAISAGAGRQRGRVPEALFPRVLDEAWNSLFLAAVAGGRLLGATGDDDPVCGIVVSVRSGGAGTQDTVGAQGLAAGAGQHAKLAVWLGDARNEASVKAVGDALRKVLAASAPPGLGGQDVPQGGWRAAFEDFQRGRVTLRA